MRVRAGGALAPEAVRHALAAASAGSVLESAEVIIEPGVTSVRCACGRDEPVTHDALAGSMLPCGACGALIEVPGAHALEVIDVTVADSTEAAEGPSRRMESPMAQQSGIRIARQERRRLHVALTGAVQGVGFRPFVHRLATRLGLDGWVQNSPQGVIVEAEGAPETLARLLEGLRHDLPPQAAVYSEEVRWLDAAGLRGFAIRQSGQGGARTGVVLPDLATCADCRRELDDPRDRRFRYPFTNCTNCGPRFSIILALPYDRPATTMSRFTLCPDCRREYDDPADRRFHAQPNACPACGPRLALWDPAGAVLARDAAALAAAAEAVRSGGIVAVKGLGGFHLVADARNDGAVRELRERKRREEKPLAVMVRSVGAVRAQCDVSEIEERLLASPQAPIVLLEKRIRPEESPLAESLAPGQRTLGVMLPYTPLHHLLVQAVAGPIVATSGNLSDEPICTDESEALDRLEGIADLFLVHNRPIARHVDDSVVRVVLERELLIRRARGYAPLPVPLKRRSVRTVLAVGGHLKNTVALTVGSGVVVSQHLGDLETVQAYAAFQQAAENLARLHEARPQAVACDAHPDYRSTQYAGQTGLPVVAVQHHYAHVLSCMAENDLEPPVLGVAWDGTGYGLDGTVWGGEFLRVGARGFERAAHLRTFRLPGGDQAVKEPRRSALGVLYELFGEGAFSRREVPALAAFTPKEREVLRVMLRRGIHAPITSSAGRLFDAVAALIGLRQVAAFEAQAAMLLEDVAGRADGSGPYPVRLGRPGGADSPIVIDWGPMVRGLLEDRRRGVDAGIIAANVHETLVEYILAAAAAIGERRVALSGGCFQNRRLTERAVRRLRDAGFRPYWHQRVPPNDGGLSLGQALAADRSERRT